MMLWLKKDGTFNAEYVRSRNYTTKRQTPSFSFHKDMVGRPE
jgi:hypothetical protein